MCVLFIVLVAQVGPHGQLDSIKLRFPVEAIPGSVGAVIYLTGGSKGILFDVNLNEGRWHIKNTSYSSLNQYHFVYPQPKQIFSP